MVPLDQGTAPESAPTVSQPDTRSLAEVIAGLELGDEHRLNAFVERISDIDSDDDAPIDSGPDSIRNEIDKLMQDMPSEPEAGISTLALHLIDKLHGLTMSGNPHVEEMAMQRLPVVLEMFKVSSQLLGAPTLEELVRAQEGDFCTSDAQGAVATNRDELKHVMKSLARAHVDSTMSNLALPSSYEGVDITREIGSDITSMEEADTDPIEWLIGTTAQAAKIFELDFDPIEPLNKLLTIAEASLDGPKKNYDLARLNTLLRADWSC
jgi:hypothetical protein